MWLWQFMENKGYKCVGWMSKGYQSWDDILLTKNLSHFGQVIGDPSCSLIVNNANCLYSVWSIWSNLWFQNIKLSTMAPFTLNNINIELQALLLINPKQAELANQERYNSIPRRQCVCESTLPSTSTWTKYKIITFFLKDRIITW